MAAAAGHNRTARRFVRSNSRTRSPGRRRFLARCFRAPAAGRGLGLNVSERHRTWSTRRSPSRSAAARHVEILGIGVFRGTKNRTSDCKSERAVARPGSRKTHHAIDAVVEVDYGGPTAIFREQNRDDLSRRAATSGSLVVDDARHAVGLCSRGRDADADQPTRGGRERPEPRHRVAFARPRQRLITHPPDVRRVGAAMKELWVEKYRPEEPDEVSARRKSSSASRPTRRRGTCRISCRGPAGTGKTTSRDRPARDMFGENWRQNYYELNSSDERGHRDREDEGHRRSPASRRRRLETQDHLPRRGRQLTADAQAALRRTMETY